MNENINVNFKDNKLHIEGLVALRSLQKYITSLGDNDINKYTHGLMLMQKNIDILLRTIIYNPYSSIPTDLAELYNFIQDLDKRTTNL
ncbi:hypothetical protein AB836_00450 [Rickettsiales bacterium (ex Bugula neritina AB1)]|nr:hypothetical protein AB836_00450 [Rickettsiales bacterium (ex Bugula neritina AB1)]